MKRIVAILFLGVLIAGVNFNVMASNDAEKEEKEEKNVTATTSIKGKVIDQQTGEALTGVKVKIPGLNVETYTDFEGSFKINKVKPRDYKIQTSFISYEDKTFKQIGLEIKDLNTLTLEMQKR